MKTLEFLIALKTAISLAYSNKLAGIEDDKEKKETSLPPQLKQRR